MKNLSAIDPEFAPEEKVLLLKNSEIFCRYVSPAMKRRKSIAQRMPVEASSLLTIRLWISASYGWSATPLEAPGELKREIRRRTKHDSCWRMNQTQWTGRKVIIIFCRRPGRTQVIFLSFEGGNANLRLSFYVDIPAWSMMAVSGGARKSPAGAGTIERRRDLEPAGSPDVYWNEAVFSSRPNRW